MMEQSKKTAFVRTCTAVPVFKLCSVQYRYARYRYGCHTELTEVSGTGIDVPNSTKYPVPEMPAVCLGTYGTEHTLGILYLVCSGIK